MSANEFKLNADEQPFDKPDADKPKATRPRDAATLILVRGGREVMMGQRSKGHVFMPDKWVFPGGRVDPGDARAKATLYAETAGVELDDIRQISETQNYGQPQPYMMKEVAMSAAAAPVPVQTGELSFAINVQVTWALGD